MLGKENAKIITMYSVNRAMGFRWLPQSPITCGVNAKQKSMKCLQKIVQKVIVLSIFLVLEWVTIIWTTATIIRRHVDEAKVSQFEGDFFLRSNWIFFLLTKWLLYSFVQVNWLVLAQTNMCPLRLMSKKC